MKYTCIILLFLGCTAHGLAQKQFAEDEQILYYLAIGDTTNAINIFEKNAPEKHLGLHALIDLYKIATNRGDTKMQQQVGCKMLMIGLCANEIADITKVKFQDSSCTHFPPVDIALTRKINQLIAIDQLTRTITNMPQEESIWVDSVYIHQELLGILDAINSGTQLYHIEKSNIGVMLTHQARYANFEDFLKNDVLEKLLRLNVISPRKYAGLLDEYHSNFSNKQLYGTKLCYENQQYYLCPFMDSIEAINQRRLKINLPPLEYDYIIIKNKVKL